MEAFNALKGHYEHLLSVFDPRCSAYCDDAYLSVFTKRLKRSIEAGDAEAYTAAYEEVVGSGWLLGDADLLFAVLNGAELMHPPSLAHSRCCVAVIEVYEGVSEETATHLVFQAVLQPYCHFTAATPEDGEMLLRCVTFLAEEMQKRNIDDDDTWTSSFPGLSVGSAW